MRFTAFVAAMILAGCARGRPASQLSSATATQRGTLQIVGGGPQPRDPRSLPAGSSFDPTTGRARLP